MHLVELPGSLKGSRTNKALTLALFQRERELSSAAERTARLADGNLGGHEDDIFLVEDFELLEGAEDGGGALGIESFEMGKYSR